MKRTIQYFAIVTLLILAASCNMIEETPSGSGLIGFSPRSVETKAMVNSSDDLIGETFDVYDVLTANNVTSLHVDNSIAYNTSTYNWVYQEDPDSYLWADGTHKFFGFTAGAGTLSDDWKTVTVPETTLTTASTQTDILYSDIFSTAATAWKSNHAMADSVELQFHHLLSAVRVTVENHMASALTVQSVTVTLPNKAGATVDYSGTTVAPAVTAPVADGAFGGITSETTIAAEAVVDVLNPANDMTVDGAKASPFMIWPQTLEEGAATVTVDFGNNKTRSVSIPADTQWEAGKIYAYNIEIHPEQVILRFEVQDWEKKSFNFETMATASINMTNVSWMNTVVKLTQDGPETNTVNISGFAVNMYKDPLVKNGNDWTQYSGYYPAQGFFTVNYPESGLFRIGLKPAVKSVSTPDPEAVFDEDAYEIYIYDSTITGNDKWRAQNEAGEAISRNTVYFQVRAASGQDGELHKAQIDIWFKATGATEWVSAYSEVRANYALTIPANN